MLFSTFQRKMHLHQKNVRLFCLASTSFRETLSVPSQEKERKKFKIFFLFFFCVCCIINYHSIRALLKSLFAVHSKIIKQKCEEKNIFVFCSVFCEFFLKENLLAEFFLSSFHNFLSFFLSKKNYNYCR